MAKARWGRRIAIGAVALLLVVVLAVPAIFFARLQASTPTYDDVESIATSASYQDAALLERAWSLPVARTFERRVEWQANGSTCGPTSVANVLRSLGEPRATAESVLEGTGSCWTGWCIPGITLDELATLTRAAAPSREVTILRDLELEELREHLRASNDPRVRYIANFSRGPLFGRGSGHHSPIAGYLEDLDLVLVLDVNEEYGPWLVSAERLHAALDTVDPQTGLERGLLRIE